MCDPAISVAVLSVPTNRTVLRKSWSPVASGGTIGHGATLGLSVGTVTNRREFEQEGVSR